MVIQKYRFPIWNYWGSSNNFQIMRDGRSPEFVFLYFIFTPSYNEGLNGGGPLVGCWLKFSYFVGSRLKISIFVGCRLISVNK